MSLIIFIVLTIKITAAPTGNGIDCSQSFSCEKITRTCTSSCNLNCGGSFSCRGLEARCNGQSECFATCGGSFSCSEARSPLTKTKLIGNWGLNCKGSFSCEGLQVNSIRGDLLCKGSWSCEIMNVRSIEGDIRCEGSRACRSITATCKDGATCTAKCTNSWSCSKDSGYSSSPSLFTGHWNLECTQSYTCQNIEARCPTGKSCMATCTGFRACQGANFIGNWMRMGQNGGD